MIAQEGRERPARPRRCSRWSCSARLFRYCDRPQMAISKLEEPPDKAVSTREQRRFSSISRVENGRRLGQTAPVRLKSHKLCWASWMGCERVNGGLVPAPFPAVSGLLSVANGAFM